MSAENLGEETGAKLQFVKNTIIYQKYSNKDAKILQALWTGIL